MALSLADYKQFFIDQGVPAATVNSAGNAALVQQMVDLANSLVYQRLYAVNPILADFAAYNLAMFWLLWIAPTSFFTATPDTPELQNLRKLKEGMARWQIGATNSATEASTSASVQLPTWANNLSLMDSAYLRNQYGRAYMTIMWQYSEFTMRV